MRVYDASTRRTTQFAVQINWSRESAFSFRQRFWIEHNIPNVPGVYMLVMREHHYSYTRSKRSPVIYFGSGWILDRLLFHLTGDNTRRNPIIAKHLEETSLGFRWAQIEDDDDADWPCVAEAILVYEFERRYRELPPANRIRPPRRPDFDASHIMQHPFDVIDEL